MVGTVIGAALTSIVSGVALVLYSTSLEKSRHGLKKVRTVVAQRVLSDNGSAYRSRLVAAACPALALGQRFTRPYTPRTNGKAERFIQTLLREWAYAVAYPSSAHRTTALVRWLHYYNWHRPHSALHRQPPISRVVGRDDLLRLHS